MRRLQIEVRDGYLGAVFREDLSNTFANSARRPRDQCNFAVETHGLLLLAVGKALGVLGHAERFEPVRNLLHRGPQPAFIVA